MTTQELSEILTAEEIAQYLRINVRRVYDNLNLSPQAGGIPNFKLGKQKRVDKIDFLNWMEGQKGKQVGS